MGKACIEATSIPAPTSVFCKLSTSLHPYSDRVTHPPGPYLHMYPESLPKSNLRMEITRSTQLCNSATLFSHAAFRLPPRETCTGALSTCCDESTGGGTGPRPGGGGASRRGTV